MGWLKAYSFRQNSSKGASSTLSQLPAILALTALLRPTHTTIVFGHIELRAHPQLLINKLSMAGGKHKKRRLSNGAADAQGGDSDDLDDLKRVTPHAAGREEGAEVSVQY